MADNTKKAGAPAAATATGTATASGSGSILGKYLPQGVTEKDIVVTGELAAQFLGKPHLDRAKALNLAEAPTLVGFFDRVEVLPIQERETGQDFCPYSLLLRDLEAPAVGFRGSIDKRVEVNVEKGGKMLLPITGAIGVNREVMEMVRDMENIYMVGAQPIGEERVNKQPTPMVKWKIEVVNLGSKINLKRASKGGQWALPAWYVLLVNMGHMVDSIREREHMGLLKVAYSDGIDVTPQNNVVNRTTGEIIGRLDVQSMRMLPAPTKSVESQASLVS